MPTLGACAVSLSVNAGRGGVATVSSEPDGFRVVVDAVDGSAEDEAEVGC
jgi:hypothetical protein